MPNDTEEFSAWSAFQTLRSPDPTFDQPVDPLDATGPTARGMARETLSRYVTDRRALGLPLFPTEAARATAARNAYHAKLFTQPLADVMPAEDHARLESRAKVATDPDRYRARQVLKTYLGDVFGTRLPPEQFDQARAQFARQHLGLKDDTSDKAVFAALKGRFTEDNTAADALHAAGKQLFTDTLSGAVVDPKAGWDALAPTLPERSRPQLREAYLETFREARAVNRRLTPVVTGMEIKLKALRDTSRETGNEIGLGHLWDEAASLLPDNPQDRGVALAMLHQRMQGWSEDERVGFSRLVTSAERGLRDRARGFYRDARAYGERVANDVAPDSDQARLRKREGVHQEKVRQLQNLQYAEGDPLASAADPYLLRGSILAANSIGDFALTFTGPAGLLALGISTSGNRYVDARIANPEANPGLQLNAAMVSGAIETKIEQGFNALGLKFLKGKMPGLAGMMNKAGISSATGRGVIGGAAGFIGTAATEYTEEALQEATNRGLQDIANELSGITPTTDWGKFLGDWATVAGQEQRDTLAAVVPFALIAGGGASFNHFHYGDYLRKNSTLLRAIGVPEEKVREIVTTSDVAKADTALRQAFADGLEARTEQQRTEAIGVLEEQAQLLEKAGYPVVTSESNSFTEETEHVFSAPDGTRQAFPTREEALDAWRSWSIQQTEDNLDTLTRAANESVADFLTEEGKASEGTKVEEVNLALTPDEAVRRGYATPEQMQARLAIFALQEGQAATAADLRVFARRFSDLARDGTYRGGVQYFRGADPVNIVEDLAEDAWNRGLEDGGLQGQQVLAWIRQTEDATGQRYLADGYAYTEDNRMPVLEALSKLSTEYFLGHAKASSFPEALRQWLDMILAVAANTFRHARTLARSQTLIAAIKAGKIDSRFEALIADSVGLDPAAIERRVMARHHEQLAAEAMGGFPEISEAARGRIPHPETLRKEGVPLAGEVRRLWESLLTATKRRRKDGSHVDDTQRANGYFLPVGEMADLDDVRQALNEKGFDFTTPADMLDALETSLGYGRPVYGTASRGTAETFSLSDKGIQRLEAAIAKKLTAAPEERAAFYQRLRDKLASITLTLRDMDAGRGPFARKATDEAGEERRRIRDAYAEARAIVDALPMEARGKVSISLDDILSPTTERGRVNALIRLIDQADEALESVLKTEYLDAFETLLDLAKPDLRQNKSLKGRLTPETQRLVGQIVDAVNLDTATAAIRLHNAKLALDEIHHQSPDTPEAVTAWEAELIRAGTELEILETFTDLSKRSAAEMASALEALRTVYTKGRTARRIIEESKRAELAIHKREVLESLPEVTQASHSKRTADKGLLDLAESFRLGLSSFHEVMEWMFPKSVTARTYQERIRKADRKVTRAKIDARERFDAFMRSTFGLEGISAKRKANRILAAISTRRDDWNIQLREGIKSETESMSPEQAQAILSGQLKPGWETDPIAMESLRQALADFRLARLKDQSRAQYVRFSRIVSRGKPSFLNLSDLEAVYLLQLHAQEQYRPALDRYGFTQPVIDAITAKLDPRARDIAGHLRAEYDSEYDRLNPVYRELFGMDMPRIRNYAPGIFENLDTKGEPAQLDAYGSPATQVNAMSAGFTKARTHHMARPRQANALAAYWSHLEATEYFISYAEIMRDMRQIFRSPDVRRSIENAYGTRVGRDFATWLDALEVDGQFRSANMAALQELISRTLTTQSAIGLAYNVGTIFKQASAALGFIMEMPHTAAIKGLVGAIRNPASLRTVWKSETIQQRILAGVSPEDRRLLDAANASPSIVMELLEIGRMPVAWADAAFTTISGAVAYQYHLDQALKSGMHPGAAEMVALQAMDRVVTRTAQPATTQDKSLAELSATGFTKALFLFKSDPRQKLAGALGSLRQAMRGDISKPEAVRRAFYRWAVYGILAEVMSDVWASIWRTDDDEDRWSVRDYIASAIAGPLAGLPLLGAGIESAIRYLVGTKAFTNSANPIDKAVGTLFNDKGFNSAVWKALSQDEPPTVAEILQATLRDSASLAQIVGVIDPRAAIVPAAARLARDTAGILGNAADLVMEDSPEDKAAAIVAEEAKLDKKGTAERTNANKALAKELEALPEDQRARRIASLDKTTRTAVESRLRRHQLTPAELSLSNLSTERRSAAIKRILDTMPERERPAYLDRLRSLRLLPKGFTE